jgi:signal transduction histidine kinase
VSNNTTLFITKELPNIDELIPKASAIHVFRTIQEALSNVVKHADAAAAKVTFSIKDEGTLITVQDNGKGFDPELTVVKMNSLGLKTMQERIATIGGKFKIKKGDPKGTEISIFLPKKKK